MLIEREATQYGDTLLYQGRHLYSSRNPYQSAVRALPKSIDAHTCYVMVSPLLCYGLDLFFNELPASSAMLLLEVEPNLSYFTQQHNSLEIKSERLKSMFGAFDAYELEAWFKSLEFLDLRQLVFVYPSFGHHCAQEVHAQVKELINRLFKQYQRNNMMLQVVRKRWLRNTIAQLGMPLAGHQRLERTNRPIVVIGAGLTLEYAASWLQQVAASYYLIAVDTALPSLLAYGIEPDVVVVLEASTINILDFMASQNRLEQTMFLVDISAHPQTLRLFAGRVLSIVSDFSYAQLFQDIKSYLQLTSYTAAGSVGISALMLALRLTTAQVILCGLDFAYPLGRSHAKGAYSHILQLSQWQRMSGIPKLQEALRRPLVHASGQQAQRLQSDGVLIEYAQAITQSQSERLYALASPYALDMHLPIWDEREPIMQPKEQKSALEWRFNYHPSAQKQLITREIGRLKSFLTGDTSGLAALNYLHMGQHRSLVEHREETLDLLAKEVLEWWQRSEDGWLNE